MRRYLRDPQVLTLEQALLDDLAGELKVPIVLANGQGWVLLSFSPGQSLQAAAKSASEADLTSAAHDLGSALACLAHRRFATAGFLDAELRVAHAWESAYAGLRGYLDECLSRPLVAERVGTGLIRKVETAWDSLEATLDTATLTPNLSHGDFKPSNVIIDQGRVTGIIDWEFAHAGTWLLDAGQMLRHRDELPQTFATQFEQGMRDGGISLPDDWQTLADVIDSMNLIDFLGRAVCDAPTQAHIVQLIKRNLSFMA